MNAVDVLLVLAVAAFSILGAQRGLAAQALSLGGLALGAVVGSLVAPYLFPDNSTWLPIAGLLGALVGAVFLGAVASALGRPVRLFLAARPSLAVLDRLGGILVGGLIALAVGWLVAVLALHQPALGLRSEVRESVLLPRLLRAVPPDSVLQALNRFDPLPLLPGLEEALPPPDPSVLQSAGARAAAGAVVKIEGTSCDVGTQGSGWVVRRGLVATNAHVIAGHDGTRVLAPNGQVVSARPVYVDAANDIALLRVRGLGIAAIAASPQAELPRPVALLGYPRNGPLTATAATAGDPRTVLSPDAYGGQVRPRVVVPLRGAVHPGESGGPVVDRRGRVVAMIFGGTRGGSGGYAVPVNLVLDAAAGPLRAVSSGPCIVR
ncbi:MAG: CvpA family protein [Gaiellaceae bacterium]